MADPLIPYRAKRDFTRTAEPSGERRISPAPRLRFVIQKHAATRLHYDFRLELDGVMKSWAVTKGPSLDPHERRLAVEVEDHPLDYGDFEGTIPEGQYGGGTVMVWDRGYWEPEGDPEKALKKGHLSFQLDGDKLNGGWTLVRMRDRDTRQGRHNWLLIKHEDETAHEGDQDELLTENDRSAASGRTLDEIAAGKKPGPKPFITRTKGAADAVWGSNRADPLQGGPAKSKPQSKPQSKPRKAAGKRASAMPDFVEPALAQLVDRAPGGAEWLHEIKFDGYRMQLRVEGGRAQLLTRKKLDWTHRFPEIAKDAEGLPDCLLDGEIIATDAEGQPDFAGLQAALSDHKTAGLVYYLFDALFAEGRDLRGERLTDRKEALRDLLDRTQSKRLLFTEHFQAPGQAVLESACRMHLEGVVSKRADSPYRSGRTGDWTKAKCRGGQEVVIGGWATTEGRFRSLLVGLERDGKLISAGRVGTGFGRDKVEKLLPQLQALETDKSPFTGHNAPKKAAGVHWVKPELVAEIDFAGFTGDGNVRQASFKALREDKPPAEVVAEIPASADPPPAKPASKAARGSAVVAGVSISHPEKALWPADEAGPAVTKLDLARYLESVARWLVPYLKGRPCSIIRTPDSIAGQRFYQRHAGAGTSSLITLVTVSGDRQPYLQFDTLEAVIAAAQSGTTELHPWNSWPGDPNLPGRFVFDLDPDEALPFERVIEAAKEVRDRLERLGLPSVLKTTGGKGLHVVAPFAQDLKNPVEWAAAKAFAKGLCEQMAKDSPRLYTTNMAKKERPGRIFLDYLRNDRMASAVALLSPRARAGAPVSFPLAWSQAKKGLDPKAFTVHTAAALMAKRDPWGDYEKDAGSLRDAIEKVMG